MLNSMVSAITTVTSLSTFCPITLLRRQSWFNLGLARRFGDGAAGVEPAIAAFEKALALHPALEDAHIYLSSALACTPRLAAARTAAFKALSVNPSSVEVSKSRSESGSSSRLLSSYLSLSPPPPPAVPRVGQRNKLVKEGLGVTELARRPEARCQL
jgi:tetratricopeptide (TPR) repeat protein